MDAPVIEALADRCASRSKEGARAVGKVISSDVLMPMIAFFAAPGNESVRRVRVSMADGRPVVQPV